MPPDTIYVALPGAPDVMRVVEVVALVLTLGVVAAYTIVTYRMQKLGESQLNLLRLDRIRELDPRLSFVGTMYFESTQKEGMSWYTELAIEKGEMRNVALKAAAESPQWIPVLRDNRSHFIEGHKFAFEVHLKDIPGLASEQPQVVQVELEFVNAGGFPRRFRLAVSPEKLVVSPLDIPLAPN